MPDLDDLFEDIVDGVKKKVRKQRKARKKRLKAQAKHTDLRRMEVPVGKEIAPAPSRSWNSHAERLFNLNGGLNGGQNAASTIQNSVLRGDLERARAYQAAIKELTRQSSTSFNRGRMKNLTGQVDHWYNSLTALVQQVEAFQQNTLLQQDLARVPAAINRLETQLAEASSPRLEQELTRTLHNRRLQLDALQNLEATMQWAELKVESTVSMLGSIYSQAVMSQSKGQVADHRRLLDDIEEEARSLDDYVTVLAEIKFGAPVP